MVVAKTLRRLWYSTLLREEHSFDSFDATHRGRFEHYKRHAVHRVKSESFSLRRGGEVLWAGVVWWCVVGWCGVV